MLDNLDKVPWADLEHAYGSAANVPDQLRKLLDSDPKVRGDALGWLYNNVAHQGTRYEATAYVIPFLIDMCGSPDVTARGDLLRFWGDLIVGYFSIQERPIWGDGTQVFELGVRVDVPLGGNRIAAPLHAIYKESLAGESLLYELLNDEDKAVRASAAWVLACLPTIRERSLSHLIARLEEERNGWVRMALAFALGELDEPKPLIAMLINSEEHEAAQCMAVCELARISGDDRLIEPLVYYVSRGPIEGYEVMRGAGGPSTGDAAFSIALLSLDARRQAIPAICERLLSARSFATMPLVSSVLAAAFERRKEPLTELTPLQRWVMLRMLDNVDLWSIGNLSPAFSRYGLKMDREKCAHLAGVKLAKDDATSELSDALIHAEVDFLEQARAGIDRALRLDPAVFARTACPDEAWLFTAKAFAETDPERAIQAYLNARSANPQIRRRVSRGWALADLLEQRGIE